MTIQRSTETIAPIELPRQAETMLSDGFRLALVAGHDDDDALRAVYVFTAAKPDRRVELHVPLERDNPRVPSLASLSFPAGRFEREMHDLFGIVPVDHPLPRRLVRHFHWPKGWHPMLRDSAEPPQFGDVDGPYPFQQVDGDGVYEIPVGPVHAGMIGPGHFRFSVVGETILKLKARLWFVHRGVERLFEGRRPEHAVELAERISGDTTVGHTLAFCLAVEDAAGVHVPEDARRVRAILLELERLYNHVADIGALCNDVGYGIANSHALRIREQLLRCNDRITGHRLLRGAITPGGARVHELPDPDVLAAIAADATEIVRVALANTVVRDRFAGTAVLRRQQAHDLGVIGFVARASGLDIDARSDHPLLAPESTETYSKRIQPTHTDGDVLSRFMIRAEEIQESIALITHLVTKLDGRLGGNAPTSTVDEPPRAAAGLGICEGWRGTIAHRIEIAADGTLRRAKVVDPSFFNWPALPVALADTIVPDFPLTNKSFNLSYSGNDL